MKTQTKTTEEINKQPKWKQLGFQKGDVRKFVWKKQESMSKGKGKKEKKNPPKFIQKGVDGQKPKKNWNFEREDKRKTRKKTE